MARFTKHNSNYVKTIEHQKLKDGTTIFERDWVTIGGRWNFGPGKVPYYTDSNFIFTTSYIPNYQKKHKNGTTVGEWGYDDVANASPNVNNVTPDEFTEDIRSFVCYGSCFELVRVTVENIIKTFPGSIVSTNQKLDYLDGEEYKTIPGFILSNPFGLDFTTSILTEDEYDNSMKYLAVSYGEYIINGEEITSYEVKLKEKDEKCPQNDQYDKRALSKDIGVANAHMIEVVINEKYNIYGYKYRNGFVFCYDGALEIKPKEQYIEDYFNGLKGFEKCLLNRKSQPLYTNRFVTPIEYSMGYAFYKRTYTWPTIPGSYCIDVVSPVYTDFITNLSNMALLFDELCTDNIWRKLTHESIRNYDWTYTREFEEGEEQDNIDGGERMRKVLNLIGRMFDDNKRYIDMIKHINRANYSGDRNMANALLSDKLEENGISAFSTIPSFTKDDNYAEYTVDDDFLEEKGIKWFPTKNNDNYTFADVDIDFMRKMILSSKRINQSKGTINAIEMVMGMFGYGYDKDFTIREEYRIVKPIEYDDKVDNSFINGIGEEIVRLNLSKDIKLQYNSDTSGVPISSFVKTIYDSKQKEGEKIKHKTYVIPYYSQYLMYDGDLHFQSAGGWLKKGEKGEYTETLSYLHVVPTISDLLNVNPNSIAKGDIYYVVNVNDYTDYSESMENGLNSNFFVVINPTYCNYLASWESVDMNEDSDDAKKARYLDSIIPETIGNNPHVGYGRYDNGEEFFDYMKMPFKYSIDKHLFDSKDEEIAKKIVFDIKPHNSNVTRDTRTDDKIHIWDDTEKEEDTYYLNSKVIYYKDNNFNNEYYKEYFKNVILKYLMQVIPSTAILVLEGFDSNGK